MKTPVRPNTLARQVCQQKTRQVLLQIP